MSTKKDWKPLCFDPLCEIHTQPKPTGEWTVVPRALHFNIVCDDTTIYEGVTSEKQGKHLADVHNAALDAAKKEAYEKGFEKGVCRIQYFLNGEEADKAISAAQQPLVDALTRIADGEGMPCDTLQSIAEHELAKVKEGK